MESENEMKKVLSGLVLAMLIFPVAILRGQMVNPAIDKKGEPFSYPSAPTEEMSLPGAPLGTEITPCGDLYTGYGELDFFIGYPPKPGCQRTRTLTKGYLPIFHYTYQDGTILYVVTTFTCPLMQNEPDRRPVNLIRVVASNTGKKRRTSYFSVAFRYTGDVTQSRGQGAHRFRRPALASKPGDYSQPGVPFNPDWVYGFSDVYATRAGKIVYEFPSDPEPSLWLTPSQLYTRARKMSILPDTPTLLAQYKLSLSPGGSKTLVFKMPVDPIGLNDSSAVSKLHEIDFKKAMAETTDSWESVLSRGIQIHLPEKKVENTFRANLIYDMMAIDHTGENYIQTVNKLQYHAFWLRDGSFIMSAYDVTGHFDLARRCLLFFLKFQRPDGLFISNRGQYDGWGQALWAFGRYYQFTQDRDFAQRVYPAVQHAVAWLHSARENDPLHLMPATNPHDAEFTKVAAHVTGQNFWALDGLREAIVLAKAVGTRQDVKAFKKEYNDYDQVLVRKLKEVTSKDNGYIPPGIDVQGGQDWGNLGTLYPGILFPPFDPMVTGTLRAVRAKYGEGLMTYAGRLHHYLTMKNTEAELVREEQKQVVEDLYAILVHTSSTQAGWEVGPFPWTTRDFGEDLSPHGWFAAEYVVLLRNMLLREQGDELHLLSALSPAWCRPGDTIEVTDAPTYFGRMGIKALFGASTMTLDLNTKFRSRPADIVVHIPWFVTPQDATVDGRHLKMLNHRLIIPCSAHRITIRWFRNNSGSRLSYARAVEKFLEEYSKRYQQFLLNGSPEPKPWVTH